MASVFGCACSLTAEAGQPRGPSEQKAHANSAFLLLTGQLRKLADATLGSGNLRNAVKLPEGEVVDEWIAVHSALVLTSGRLL